MSALTEKFRHFLDRIPGLYRTPMGNPHPAIIADQSRHHSHEPNCRTPFGLPRSPDPGPIFIGGTGRSGTTVLARLLGFHPRIFMLRWETQMLVADQGLLDLIVDGFSDRAVAAFEKKLRGEWYRRTLYQGRPNEYTAGICDDIHWQDIEGCVQILYALRVLDRLPDDLVCFGRDFANAIFVPEMLRRGSTRWGEKTPRNILYLDLLWRTFPNMRFVHIVRDGRDVVSSMLKNGFWPVAPSSRFPETLPFRGAMSTKKAAEYWVVMLNITRQLGRTVPKENYFEMRLEDLVVNQEKELKKLMDFVGEPMDEGLLRFPLNRSNMGRWKKELTEDQILQIVDIAGDELANNGYFEFG